MDFHPFEDTELDIGVLLRERLGFLKRIGLDDDQASSPVRQGSGEHDSALRVERFQSCKVRRSMDLPPCLSIGTVEAKNDKFHHGLNRLRFVGRDNSGDRVVNLMEWNGMSVYRVSDSRGWRP